MLFLFYGRSPRGREQLGFERPAERLGDALGRWLEGSSMAPLASKGNCNRV